jgi:hypothetical protein
MEIDQRSLITFVRQKFLDFWGFGFRDYAEDRRRRFHNKNRVFFDVARIVCALENILTCIEGKALKLIVFFFHKYNFLYQRFFEQEQEILCRTCRNPTDSKNFFLGFKGSLLFFDSGKFL